MSVATYSKGRGDDGRGKDRGKRDDRFARKMEAKQNQTSLVKTEGRSPSARKTAHFVRWEDHSLCSLGRTDQARGTMNGKMEDGRSSLRDWEDGSKRPKDQGRPPRQGVTGMTASLGRGS